MKLMTPMKSSGTPSLRSQKLQRLVTTSAQSTVAKTALAEEEVRTTTRRPTTVSALEFHRWQTAKACAWRRKAVRASSTTATVGVKPGLVQRELVLAVL